MAAPVLRGSSQPQLQYWEVDWSLTQGAKMMLEYKGIDLSQMSALANSVSGLYDGKLRYEKNVATLSLETSNPTGNIPGGINSPFSNITDKWEIGVDQEKPELFENKNFLGQINLKDAEFGVPASEQLIQAMRQVVNNGTQANAWKDMVDILNTTAVVDANGKDLESGAKLVDVFSDITLAGFKYFFDDYMRGRTNFLKGKYLLRHTTSAPSDYGANIADFNVENIYSIAQLLSEAQSRSLWYLPLPGYLAYKILSYPVPINMPPNYVWGALKMGSGAITAARNRVEITTEYLIDACPKHTYGLIS